MKHTSFSPVLGLLPLLGLGGCGMFSGDRIPEVTNAARLNVAMAAEASGDHQMAVQIYAGALARDPSDVQAAIRYARALVNNRQVGLARELLSRQMASRPGHPDLSREFATIEVMQGQAASAVPRFDVALAANANDVRALVNKGIALDMLGRHPEAQQLYLRADALSPDDPAVRNNMAMSLMLLGRAAEANQVLQGVANHADNSPRMRNNMAVVAAANGDMARARQLTAGDISDVELQSLVTQLRVAPVDETPVASMPMPVSVAPVAATPVIATPVAVSAPSGQESATPIPLAVPAPASAASPRAVPVRAQNKPNAGRLNMTAVTPAVIARVLERAIEKEAAYIGAAPTAAAAPVFAAHAQMRPASVGATAPAVATAMAGPRRTEAAQFGYSVQLASVGSEEGARTEWRTINRRLPFMMQGREAMVDRATRGEGGFFWRLRTPGFSELGAARQFCAELQQAGQDCFVTGGRRTLAAANLPARPVVAPDAATGSAAQSPEG